MNWKDKMTEGQINQVVEYLLAVARDGKDMGNYSTIPTDTFDDICDFAYDLQNFPLRLFEGSKVSEK